MQIYLFRGRIPKSPCPETLRKIPLQYRNRAAEKLAQLWRELPAHSSRFMLNFQISLLVPLYFVDPKLCIGFRYSVIATAFMPMPKASIHKDACSVLPHHDIWFPWQPWMVQPIAVAVSPKVTAHYHLWFSVLSVDSHHVRVALWGCLEVAYILSIITCSLQCRKNSSRVLQKPR